MEGCVLFNNAVLHVERCPLCGDGPRVFDQETGAWKCYLCRYWEVDYIFQVPRMSDGATNENRLRFLSERSRRLTI